MLSQLPLLQRLLAVFPVLRVPVVYFSSSPDLIAAPMSQVYLVRINGGLFVDEVEPATMNQMENSIHV
jgi:hypothetical protein